MWITQHILITKHAQSEYLDVKFHLNGTSTRGNVFKTEEESPLLRRIIARHFVFRENKIVIIFPLYKPTAVRRLNHRPVLVLHAISCISEIFIVLVTIIQILHKVRFIRKNRDYAVDMVDLSYYDGTELTDENYVDNILLDDILRSIKSAAVQTLPPTRGGIPDDALSLTWPWITSHSVDMSIAAYKYNYIKTNAIEDGLINYNSANNKVSDAYKNGVWQNPYGETEVFAFSPSSNVSRTRNITFKFSSSGIFRNLQEPEHLQSVF